jgi:diguanylate cyclase (GGDEF)-like protein
VTAQLPMPLTDGALSGRAFQANSIATTNEKLSCDAFAKELELRVALQRVDALRAHEAALERRIEKLERALSKARESAFYDELTGLPNRRLLLSRFKRAVARGMRRGHSVAMLLLDLDGFKLINDVFGHAAGDIVLRQVAIRLNACLRASDTACRYGGDEFMTLLPDLEDEGNAIGAASKIRAHLAPPYRFRGMALNVTVSIGMAMYPIDGKEYGELARRADQAMYREKAASVVRRASLYPTPQRLEPRV